MAIVSSMESKTALLFLLPSLARRGRGRFSGDRMTPLNPPLARAEEILPTFLGSALRRPAAGGGAAYGAFVTTPQRNAVADDFRDLANLPHQLFEVGG